MKIISEFEGDNIRGSFVTDSIEYGITGKVLSREPLHVSAIRTHTNIPSSMPSLQSKWITTRFC